MCNDASGHQQSLNSISHATRTSVAILVVPVNGHRGLCPLSIFHSVFCLPRHCLPPLTLGRDRTTTCFHPRSIMCVDRSFTLLQLLLLLMLLTVVCPLCLADCSTSPPSSQAVYTTSIGAGSASTIASITCPSGQTAVSTYWNVRSSDGASPLYVCHPRTVEAHETRLDQPPVHALQEKGTPCRRTPPCRPRSPATTPSTSWASATRTARSRSTSASCVHRSLTPTSRAAKSIQRIVQRPAP